MEIIKRRILPVIEPIQMKIKAIGFNTNEVLTISCKDGDEDFLINLNGEDLKKLKNFLERID